MRIQDRIRELSRIATTWACDGEQLATHVAMQLFEDLNTPTSLGLFLALKHGDLDSVVNHEVHSRNYLDPFAFRDDYLAVSFLSKFPFKGRESITRRQAVEKFLEAEVLCRSTNLRFRRYRVAPLTMEPEVHAVFHGMSRTISSILGNFDLEEWYRNCRFGPGATDMVTGPRATIYDKLSCSPSATADASPAALAAFNAAGVWVRSVSGLTPFDDGPYRLLSESDLHIAPGNKVTFVPKNAKTDRAIAVEPHLNIYLQLGIGTMVRRRLKRVGVDLDDQSPNQRLAYFGSCTGGVATIDLSSASDTISREVVREFLPETWYYYMDLIRSKTGTAREVGLPDVIQYEKFSSMGNGFTFELESLIFFALAVAVTQMTGGDTGLVRVYGDDIVVPTSAVSLLTRMLGVLGFKTNEKKSFSEGPFRESCGRDFFDGHDVRPYFQKESPSNASQIIRMANGLRRLAYSRNNYFGCDFRLRNAWVCAVRRLPDTLRRSLRGPLYQPIVGNPNGHVEVYRKRLAGYCFCDDPPGPSQELAPVEGSLGSGFAESQVSPFVRLRTAEKQRGWDDRFYSFARFLAVAKTFRPNSLAYSYASFSYGLARGRSSPEITKSRTDDDAGSSCGLRITPFSVPYRGLTTEKVTIRGKTRGWLDNIQWV